MGVGKSAWRIFDLVLNVLVFFAGILLVFLMIIVSMEALGRYFYNHSLIWVTQISEYSLLFITFLGAAWLLREEGHVTVELIIERMRPRRRAILTGITSFIIAVTFLLITVYGVQVVLDLWARGVYDPTLLKIPKAPIVAVIPLGSILLVVQALRRSYRHFRKAILSGQNSVGKSEEVSIRG
ncbi:MAG: TRAP transporter small permease [Desulfitobacteriaceae bacterium]